MIHTELGIYMLYQTQGTLNAIVWFFNMKHARQAMIDVFGCNNCKTTAMTWFDQLMIAQFHDEFECKGSIQKGKGF